MSRALRLLSAVVVLLVPAAPATASEQLLRAPASAAARPHGPFPTIDSIAPRHLRVGQVLTIRGHAFVPGNGRNTVVFSRPGARYVFVRAGRSSATRIHVRLPAVLLAGVRGAPRYIRLRMRVLSRRFAEHWTSPSRSPYIAPLPHFDVPKDRTVEATGPGGARVDYSVRAHDLAGDLVRPACAPASGATFPLGRTRVSCAGTDREGLRYRASFTVDVVDTTAPKVVVPADMTREAAGPAGATIDYSASASDLVSGSVPTVCSPPSGTTFPRGTTTVTCTATDAAGNTGSASFAVRVADSTAPTLKLPADMTVEATAPAGAKVDYSASASDSVDGNLPVTCTPASGTTFSRGATKVNCTATDSAGNQATGSFTVTVVDTTPPTVTVPADMTVTATGPSGATVNYTASANDRVDGSVPVSCSPPSGSTFTRGTTQVTCTATDAAGNRGTASFNVTVVDPAPPSP